MTNPYKEFSAEWKARETHSAMHGIKTNTSVNADAYARYNTPTTSSYPAGTHRSLNSGQGYGATSTSSGSVGFVSGITNLLVGVFCLLLAFYVYGQALTYDLSSTEAIFTAIAITIAAAAILQTKIVQFVIRSLVYVILAFALLLAVGWFFLL